MDRESRKRASNDFQKQTGEEPEPEEDSPPGSQKREFQQVTKSEPKGISAWGLRHPLLLVEIYPYTTGIGGKRQGTWVLAGSKIGQNLIGYQIRTKRNFGMGFAASSSSSRDLSIYNGNRRKEARNLGFGGVENRPKSHRIYSNALRGA